MPSRLIRFVLKRDIVQVPIEQGRRLIEELERSGWSPEMRASVAAKIGRAISDLPLLSKITLSLGERVTLNETLREAASSVPSLPPALRRLRVALNDDLDRARNGEARREQEARRVARRERESRRRASLGGRE